MKVRFYQPNDDKKTPKKIQKISAMAQAVKFYRGIFGVFCSTSWLPEIIANPVISYIF